MDATAFITRQINLMHFLCEAATNETTDEQFNWQPPGTANTIRASFIHMVHAEDFFIHHVIQGKPRLWESENWAAKFEINTPPGRGRGWEEVTAKPLPVAPALEYQKAVRADTDAYLETLTAEELDREVRFFGGMQPVAQVIATLVAHTMGHSGDIAAIKGMQGVKGLPF
jgi:uncharacterized damage-inducible protein DinB